MCGILGYIGEKLSKERFQDALSKLNNRGPDMSKTIKLGNGFIGFARLAIMELTEKGMQPFYLNNNLAVCNGAIYGFRGTKENLIKKGYKFDSDSDCEIILPLYQEMGEKMFETLDAEFALIIYDGKTQTFVVARDPVGIRPLFYVQNEKEIAFASEAKALVGIMDGEIKPFPAGHYYKDGKFICYNNISHANQFINDSQEKIYKNIHDKLVDGIVKRLDSDAPVGFLLSGGLDSSLVCAVASKYSKKPIKTFAIGMVDDAIDLKYAKQVADFIGSDHTEIYMTKDDVLNCLDELIYKLETWDITTIRASVGMYLLCKAIKENTNIRVLLTGEISDELFGYKYTDFAPSANEFQKESEKRIREIFQYDVLRADRCIASNSLEARVPFGDLKFVKYVMSINPEKKLIKNYGKGKFLLRKSFEQDGILPESILWREKAAFSDAVGHSMVDYIKEFAEQKYTDDEFNERKNLYSYHCPPFTKESLLYREIFEKHYPKMAKMISDYWMPNKSWKGLDTVADPSARVLSNYGDSGK